MLKLLTILLLVYAFPLVTCGKKCFAPVTCADGETSSTDWLQVFPPLQCQSTSNHYSIENNSHAHPEYIDKDTMDKLVKVTEATSCEELNETYGISKTGTYLMKVVSSGQAVYYYCDFAIREGVSSCYDLGVKLGSNATNGYYLVTSTDTPDRPTFIFCDFTLPQDFPQDCRSVKRENAKIRQSTGGVFDIYPDSRDKSVEVYCDLKTDGGGWTVFQRRMDGSVDFYRDWEEYVEGFGTKKREFWLGLKTIHQLMKSGSFELRVDLMDWYGDTAHAKYGLFMIGSRNTNYTLTVGGFTGDAGDSFYGHNKMQFSTKDFDNDPSSTHCAQAFEGGWWFNDCHFCYLNGIYYLGPKVTWGGVIWYHWGDEERHLKFSEMKFRKK